MANYGFKISKEQIQELINMKKIVTVFTLAVNNTNKAVKDMSVAFGKLKELQNAPANSVKTNKSQ